MMLMRLASDIDGDIGYPPGPHRLAGRSDKPAQMSRGETWLSSAKSGPGIAHYIHANVPATSRHTFERSCGHSEVCCVVAQKFA